MWRGRYPLLCRPPSCPTSPPALPPPSTPPKGCELPGRAGRAGMVRLHQGDHWEVRRGTVWRGPRQVRHAKGPASISGCLQDHHLAGVALEGAPKSAALLHSLPPLSRIAPVYDARPPFTRDPSHHTPQRPARRPGGPAGRGGGRVIPGPARRWVPHVAQRYLRLTAGRGEGGRGLRGPRQAAWAGYACRRHGPRRPLGAGASSPDPAFGSCSYLSPQASSRSAPSLSADRGVVCI